MKILVTGSEGFIAKNLCQRLGEDNNIELIYFNKTNQLNELASKLNQVDMVFHLAGVNRPENPNEFISANQFFTEVLCEHVEAEAIAANKIITIVFTSSIQAERDNEYGRSKLAAEKAIFAATKRQHISAYIFRLPNVFGKWCRPNYNSAIATFCHNIARGLPIEVHSHQAPLSLVYIDDLIEQFIRLIYKKNNTVDPDGFAVLAPVYSTTVGDVVELIQSFKNSRQTLVTERVGAGLIRALYSTYVSYLPTNAFRYSLKTHTDSRGSFVEMLKTIDSGQFSYFTAHKGITRGGHYHHSKTEKFLVVKGKALFKFRHMQTGECYDIFTEGGIPEIVETVPGWTHDITNIGDEEMIVMLWANELFDRERPDTYPCAL